MTMHFLEAFGPTRGFANKGDWVHLDPQSVVSNKDVQQDVYEIIRASYADIGGHPDFKAVGDVPKDNDKTLVIDTDDPDDVDATILSKTTSHGNKITTFGTDGGKGAKAAMIRKLVELLDKPGNYCECSGRPLEILLNHGVRKVTDRDVIQRLLTGKTLKFNPDGTYDRDIGGEIHTKTMIGNPL
jgi:hypothetical protein